MLSDGRFWMGVIAGVVALYVWGRFGPSAGKSAS